ncbi:SOS response-associated peptidase family protein [Leptospira stimsonii]|uniref:Abasic site processing protein n=1 Tax=Leptospira stimsonii TaxID=2202203 RepID=A0ABY2N551_9LEPT|nr:SOS response-associated peptidase family protein [Leptospira stimsonii]TGK10393.1 SOS response-associated peptidase [Leptospira stimsonii]TGM17264.1 SOS response-associated peptidase [Leptospira stimsonii]
MCNKFAQIVTHADGTQRWIRPNFDPPTRDFDVAVRYELMKSAVERFPKQQIEVVYRAKSGIEKLNSFQWGLPKSGTSAVITNTRIENIKGFWSRFSNNRVLIPITNFFEFKEESGLKKPHSIWFKDFPIAYMAGIAGSFQPEENSDPIRWVTIITQEANSLMRQIHNHGENRFRQPCLVRPEYWDSWLGNLNYSEDSFFQFCKGYLSDEISVQEIEVPGSQMGLFSNPT